MKLLRVVPLLLSLAALPAAGIELQSSLRSQTGYDSNALAGGTGDMVVEVTPRVELVDADGRLTWDFGYTPTYRYFVTEGVDGGFSHIVNGRVAWQATPRLRFEVSDRFARLKNVDLETSFGIDDVSPDLIDSEIAQERTLANRAAVRVDWNATSRDVLSALFDHGFQQFDESSGRGDFSALRGRFSYRRTLTSEHEVGLDFSIRNNTQESRLTGAERTTRFYSIEGAWTWQILPSLVLRARGGPAFVDAEELDRADSLNAFRFATSGNQLLGVAGCGQAFGLTVRSLTCAPVARTPGTPQNFLFPSGSLAETIRVNALTNNTGPGLNATEVVEYTGQLVTLSRDPRDQGPDEEIAITYFADISLEKTFGEYVSWLLQYTRSASTSASDFGSSSVADQVQSVVVWTPTRFTTLRFTTGWIRRQQEQDSPLNLAVVRSTDLPGCISPPQPAAPTQCPNTPLGNALLGTFNGVGEATSFVTDAVNLDDVQDQFIVRLSGRYRLRENVYLTGSGSYRYITRDNAVATIDDDDRWRVLFGLEYRFDPITL